MEPVLILLLPVRMRAAKKTDRAEHSAGTHRLRLDNCNRLCYTFAIDNRKEMLV